MLVVRLQPDHDWHSPADVITRGKWTTEDHFLGCQGIVPMIYIYIYIDGLWTGSIQSFEMKAWGIYGCTWISWRSQMLIHVTGEDIPDRGRTAPRVEKRVSQEALPWRSYLYIYLWYFDIAMEHGSFMDDLPIKHDLPLFYIYISYIYIYMYQYISYIIYIYHIIYISYNIYIYIYHVYIYIYIMYIYIYHVYI